MAKKKANKTVKRCIKLKDFQMALGYNHDQCILLDTEEFQALLPIDDVIGTLTFEYEANERESRAHDIRQQIQQLEQELEELE